MILHELNLIHFRSYPKKTISFLPTTTIILGPNTAGKTNILEAISICAVGKSFRAEKETDMISWDQEVGRIKVKMKKQKEKSEEEETDELEVILTKGEVSGIKTPVKRYLVNGVPRRQIDFVGNLRIVLFWPGDLDLVTGSPSLRRNYLNFVLVQIDREYRRCLASYEKGIRQRNRLLVQIREGEAGRNQLIFWDQLIIRNGEYITTRRAAFVEAINASVKPFGEYQLMYDASTISVARLAHYADAEVAAGVTLVGPHRDDFQFFEKERNLAAFGSRGEQRLAVLWLKLAELEYAAIRTEQRPLLLLDDIFSELDHTHREEIVRVVGQQQTILTTTDRHFIPEGLLNIVKVIELNI